MDTDQIISYLENPENELMVSAESESHRLDRVASLLVEASERIKQAKAIACGLEDDEQTFIEALESLAAAYDTYGSMTKQASKINEEKRSVIDELLMTVAADPTAILRAKIAATKKLKDLKEEFRKNREAISVQKGLQKINRTDVAEKRVKDSGVTNEPTIVSPMKYPRESRTCPEHAGALVARVGDGVWQCSLDKKVFDFNEGFTTITGEKVTGGSIASQSDFSTFEIPAWDKPTKI